MLAFLKNLLGPRKAKRQLVRAVPGQMFGWTKGYCIEATETTVILVPGELIRDDEKIGSIIETSDDGVLLAFTESPDRKGFTHIRIKLERGQSATILRSAQAMILLEAGKETKVYFSPPAPR